MFQTQTLKRTQCHDEIILYSISLINNQNRPLIKPSNSFLSSLLPPLNTAPTHTLHDSPQFLNQRKFYPLLWIDCLLHPNNRIKQNFLSNQHQISAPLKSIFEQTFFNQQQQISFNRKDQDSHMLITGKIIQDHKNSQKNQPPKSFLFIHMTLCLENKELKNLTQDLLSIGTFLSQDIVLNCTEIDQNSVESIIQSLHQSIENSTKSSNNLSNLKRAHIICGNQINHDIIRQKHSINIYRLKDMTNWKKIAHSLAKVSSNVMESLQMHALSKSKAFTLEQFCQNYQIVEKILSKNQSKKHHHFRADLFCSQNLKNASETLFKEKRFHEQQKIRKQFQEFYGQICSETKKSELPLPEAIISFKIQEFIKNRFKENETNKTLIAKISLEIQEKILQKNEKEIQKLLSLSMAEYLSSIFSSSIQGFNPEREILQLHPEKIGLKIDEFIQTMLKTHIFVTENHIGKYVRSQMMLQYYKRLYEQFGKVKKQISGNFVDNERLIERLKGQVQNFRKENENFRREAQVTNFCRNDTENQIRKYKNSINELQDEVILWKEKFEQCKKELLEKSTPHKKMQENYFSSLKTQPKSSSLENKFENIQKNIAQKQNEHENLTKSFEYQLNIYKNQCQMLQSQLKQKIQLIDKKQEAYKQKISEMQKNLSCLKNSTKSSFEISLQNEIFRQTVRKQIENIYQQRIDSVKKQYEDKLESYKCHIEELSKIATQKNIEISVLEESIHEQKSRIITLEDQINEFKRTSSQKDQKLIETTKIIQQTSQLINSKVHENFILGQKLKQKNIKIEILEEDLDNLKSSSKVNESNLNYSGLKNTSYVRFEKDIPKALISSLSKSKSKISIEGTPQKKASRIKTLVEVNENLELEKLLEERRTIEKKKQRFEEQENLLERMGRKLGSGRVEMGSGVGKGLIELSAGQMGVGGGRSQKVLGESNRMVGDKGLIDKVHASTWKDEGEWRRRLF